MILAAGRGERMRPLTDSCPKPLLKVKGITLIEHHIKKLVSAGIDEIVINHAWLGEQIIAYLGDGSRFGAKISYSREPVALETAGGIINALALLVDDEQTSFLVVNGDVYSDIDYKVLPNLAPEHHAHLILVNNPEHNKKGDFSIRNGLLENPIDDSQQTYTFSGVALYRKSFFIDREIGVTGDKLATEQVLPLAPMLRAAATKGVISASVFNGAWTDVGTPERLALLNT